MANELIPVKIKRRQTPVRFIKSLATIGIASLSNKGVRKLSKEDTDLIASIIYTGVVKYNNANGKKLSDADLTRIQKRLAVLDVFTFDEDRRASKKYLEKQSKKLGRKVNPSRKRGFLQPLTDGLVLSKKDYLEYKEHTGAFSYIRTITHEGFHYLTNDQERDLGMERVIAEGADESFIIRTFAEGRFSNVIGDSKNDGLIHYNFYSKTIYSSAVSVLNMLGVMVNIRPELSELKLDKKYTDAIKQKYGEDFYKKLIKRSENLLDPRRYERIRNVPRYVKRLQQFVLRTITNDIVNNVQNPDDAVKKLEALQRAEEWSARIILKQKDEQNKKIKYILNKDFEYYYRRTYVRTIEKLKQKGYTNLSKVEACKYKMTQFRPLRRIILEKADEMGQSKFLNECANARIFFRSYYGKENFADVVGPETATRFARLKEKYKEEHKEEHKDDSFAARIKEQGQFSQRKTPLAGPKKVTTKQNKAQNQEKDSDKDKDY